MPSFVMSGPVDAGLCKELRPELINTSHGKVQTAVWGEGPALLSLHGAMGGYDQGILLAQTVTYPRFRFIAVSRPGYLGTAMRAGRTPQEQADLCADVLDVLGIERTAVVAISGGGPIALQFALRHPDRCRALVMISACSHRLDVPLPLQWHIMKLMARIPGITAAIRRKIEQNPEETAKRSITDDAIRRRTVRDPETGPLFLALRASTLDRMALRIPGTENDIRQTRSEMSWPLETITAPTLVVHGKSDSVVPFVQGQRLASRVPGAELMAIDGGEHVSIFTHRNEVRSRIDAFL
jgi:pimeloyl-ACP methyl ester carboxylesterase